VEVVAEDMIRSAIDIQGGLSPGDVSLLLKSYRSTGLSASWPWIPPPTAPPT
jgi:hypothetical protein